MIMYNLVQVEAIKLAVWNIEAKGHFSQEILENSIIWLLERYKESKNKVYLEKASDHIYAYLELGFCYEEIEAQAAFVTENLGMEITEIDALKKRSYPKILLSKANIRRLIGRWNPRLQSMPISAAVDDIFEKAKEKQQGEYLYHCGKILCGQEEDGIWENTYRLYVDEEKAVFQDVNRYRYYQLV